MHQFRWPVAGEDAEELVEEAGPGWKEDGCRDSKQRWSPSKLFTSHVSSELAWYPLFLCSCLHLLSSPLTLSCAIVCCPWIQHNDTLPYPLSLSADCSGMSQSQFVASLPFYSVSLPVFSPLQGIGAELKKAGPVLKLFCSDYHLVGTTLCQTLC